MGTEGALTHADQCSWQWQSMKRRLLCIKRGARAACNSCPTPRGVHIAPEGLPLAQYCIVTALLSTFKTNSENRNYRK